ncbi:hypothetical protein ABT095_36405 [Kitasatospora sp. NPDC002227]|uniref:hypothetical protein n=1 Tax=Kitasatospora sp. NPDC002227 TaxID=3154773 RepID=UPI0033191A44
MPRKPRPLDPDEGPLQSFAYELRCLRQAAGNPTYRALATTAGFSATTLSDAAGGVRRPTLEVTLAYVGACRGNAESWEKRWYALERRLAAEAGARVRPTADQTPPAVTAVLEPAQPQDCAPTVVSPPGDDGTEPRAPRRHRWPARTWLPALGVALMLVLTSLLVVLRPGSDADTLAASGCPARPAEGAAFQGTTYTGSTRVRSGASRSTPVIDQIPAGCRVQFVGYCIGDVEMDPTSGTPDVRWFKLSGGGLVASAVVHGNPPTGLPPQHCADELPAPSSISLAATRRPGDPEAAELRATGSYLGVVGFAGYFSDTGQTVPVPRWHQLGLVGVGADGFVLPWRIPKPTADQGPLQLVAAACLGGDGPTGVMDALTLPPAAPAQPLSLSGLDRTAAVRAACRYPAT